MRFEELAYAGDGLPATARFHARLTVVRVPDAERSVWMARLLGVLEGTRAGDSTSAIYVDRRGCRIGLDRDDQGSATLTELATGDEVPYSAGHLSLDGRFDWFAANGLTSRAATDLIVVDSEAFTGGQKYDPQQLEARLNAARVRLARAEKRYQSALARSRRRDDLNRQISDLDEQIEQAEAARSRREAEAEVVMAAALAADEWWRAMGAADDARRAFGSRPRLDVDQLARASARPTELPDDFESLAKTCRAMAERRDELVERLNTGASAEVDATAAEARRELIEEVEPAFVEALASLAGACRPFDVSIGAARIEAAGIDAAGIEALSTVILTEVAARVAEAGDARLQQALEESEAECRTTRQRLERTLAELGLTTDSTGDLAAGAEVVAARAAAATDPAVDDPRRMMAERARLAQALRRVERNVPDVAALGAKLSALQQEVSALEATLTAGRPLVVTDALAAFGTGQTRRLLEAIARLTETTQVIYLTDDPDAVAWASAQLPGGDITLWGPDDVATVA